VRQLVIKVLNIIDAQCNHDIYVGTLFILKCVHDWYQLMVTQSTMTKH